LKKQQITTVFTMDEAVRLSDSGVLGISSIIDTWLSVRQQHAAKRFRRELLVIKKRGTGHAHGYLPFVIGSDGLKIESDVDG
jgi:KaiC/GvpD/RAD55 family RecA-like ATPase